MKITVHTNCGRYKTICDAAVSEKEVDWWDDNDKGSIYCTESYAAVEIFNHLEMSGHEMFWEKPGSEDKDVYILIGIETVQAYGFDTADQGRDGTYECLDMNGRTFVLIWGADRLGTLNAAHMWLHSLGFRWYTPDEECSYVPERPEINEVRVKLGFDYKTRACYNEFIDDDNHGFLTWASRNCMNMLRVQKFLNPHKDKKLGLSLMGGGHEIFYKYLNPNSKDKKDSDKTYFEAHPDWFALIDGGRSNRDENKKATEGYYTGDNICTSNKEAVAELSCNMIDSFNEGDYKYLDYLNLWAYDNGTWCSCDECRALGNLARRMLMLGYDINRHFKTAYDNGEMKRRIKLVVPVYHETLEPPDKPLPDDFDYDYITATYFPIERCYAHNINDPVCTETNLRLKNLYERWTDFENGSYKGEIFIGEYYNVSSFASLPFILTDTMRNDIPYYFLTGTRHMYYMHISARKWGMLALNNNVLAGLMRDVSFNAESWFDEFYRTYYPECGKLMREFHNLLKEASRNSKYLKHYQFAGDGRIVSLMSEIKKPCKFPLAHCSFNNRADDANSSVSFYETMELMGKAAAIIGNALDMAKGNEKHKVETEFMRFDYGHKVLEFIFEYVKLREAHDSGNSEKAASLLSKLDKLRIELETITEPLEEMKYECPWYKDAYQATWHSSGFEELSSEIKK